MKKINSVLICGIIFILAFTNNSTAQEGISLAKPASKKAGDIPFSINTPEQKVAATRAADKVARANEKVTSYIAAHFKNVSGFRVSDLKEGNIVAQFNMADKAARVVYDKKGNHIYTIINYGEKDLPADEKLLVKSTYNDYVITLVQELNQRGITCYKIFLKGCTSSKEVFVYDGEITVDKEYEEK